MGKSEYEGMSCIALRDERIMVEMVAGACPFLHIYNKFKAYFSSEHAMRQRIAQLAEGGYIQSKLYINHTDGTKYALYALDSAGIEYLSDKGYTADEIRTLLPSQHTVAHELVITDTVRKLRRESMQIPYTLKYYDDPACRAHKKFLGLKAPIPDLLVDIKIRRAPEVYRLNIEVHMGSVPVLNVVDKVLKQEYQTLFLCNITENLEALRETMTNHTKLHGMVYFTRIYEFCENPGGILGSNYIALDGSTVSLYP